LNDYKSGKKNNPMMSPQAKGLSDADIANISAFLAAQK
jgi:cytochrome c553